jgi:two-component system response regulator AtoC
MTLKILIVDDEQIVHETLGDYLRKAGHDVDDRDDGVSGLKALSEVRYDIVLLDVLMPGMDGIAVLEQGQESQPESAFVIITGHARMELTIQALRAGAADFLQKPIKLPELDAVLEKAVRLSGLRRTNRQFRDNIRGLQSAEELRTRNRTFVGPSSALQGVHKQLQQAVEAGCDTILITGETGTGKEVAARAIHYHGFSEEQPFIAVSCPALPDSLVESELFGHVRGSFTGATEDRAGYFEMADGGTLFLDEVGDLSSATQAKLLRLLETRTLRRIGGSEERDLNIRVVTATNASLAARVEAGTFRQDLLYRLNVYTIHIPPLRDRREDILPLTRHFLDLCAPQRGVRFSDLSEEVAGMLLGYDFPGNVRELRNMVERAAILCGTGVIRPEHLFLPQPATAHVPRPSTNSQQDPERARVLNALQEAKWNRRQASRLLGISYSALRHRIQKFGIG